MSTSALIYPHHLHHVLPTSNYILDLVLRKKKRRQEVEQEEEMKKKKRRRRSSPYPYLIPCGQAPRQVAAAIHRRWLHTIILAVVEASTSGNNG